MAGILPADPTPWPTRRDVGLSDVTMRRTIGIVTKRFSMGQHEVFRGYPEGTQARQAAVTVKRQAIRDLENLWPRFRKNVEAHGGQTYFARDALEAVAIVANIVQSHHVQRVIKTKSMLTEELQLNRALQDRGVSVVETDLGEYIIQRAQETPSHILAPAAHKNRDQIATLFRDDAGDRGIAPPQSNDAQSLTLYARQRLREEFLQADMGITGGNFAVAETGTVVLITNEGNADMVTTLPQILVSVVGIEKIVDTWENLGVLIQQPAMNGIGQRLSSYTTFVSGPRQESMVEGPAEWHVVIVDNGRHLLRDTEFEDVLSCIRCGACLNVCPVFRQVGGHAYGSVYSGPIGIVETPLLTDWSILPELPTVACTVCHACGEACPMEIDLPHHIIQLRQEKVRRRFVAASVTRSYRWWAQLWSTAGGYRRSLRWARWGQRLYQRQGTLRSAPGIARGWFMSRNMPPVAAQTFHEWWGKHRTGGPS